METIQQTTDPAIVSGIATKVMLGGAGSTILFGLTANEVAALGGLCVAVIGLLVNCVFQYKRYKLLKDGKLEEKKL